MSRDSLIQKITKGAIDLEDGETGFTRCVHLYCEENGITDDRLIDEVIRREVERQALAAGIPLSVIRGKSRLRDHFSQDYIDKQRGKK